MMMPEITKNRILELRMKGLGYAVIAKELSLNVSTVRMHCIRFKLTDEDVSNSSYCICCGSNIDQPVKGGRKIYCSERCRSSWRRSTQRLNETVYHHICEGCGASFDTYGNKSQRYCSVLCYRNHRKKEGAA